MSKYNPQKVRITEFTNEHRSYLTKMNMNHTEKPKKSLSSMCNQYLLQVALVRGFKKQKTKQKTHDWTLRYPNWSL